MESIRKMTTDSFDGRKNVKFLRALGVPVVIVGAVLIGFGASALPAAETYSVYAEIGSDAGLSAFAALTLCITLLLVGGVISFLGGVALTAAGQLNNKPAGICAILVVLAGGACGLAAGIVINLTIVDMTFILCEDPDCNPRDGGFTDAQRDIVTVELALFDECCVPQFPGWSAEQTTFANLLGHTDPDLIGDRVQAVPFGVCTGDVFTDNCAGKVPDVITRIIAALEPVLCTCAPDQIPYNKVIQSIRNRNACEKLTDKTITIDAEVVVPRVNVQLLPIIVQQETAFFNRFPDKVNGVQAPLVGSPGSQWDPEVVPGGSFGCGLGQTKGMIWYTQLYALEFVLAPANAGVGCGVVAIVCALLAIAYLVIGRSEGDDMFNYGDSYALNMSPAQPAVVRSAADGAPARPGAAPANRVAPQGGDDVESSVPEAVPATAADRKSVRVMQAKREALEKRLNEFYARHEPAKLTNGRIHPDVVTFGLSRGVPALNAKLRAKYGTDLDDDGYSESSGGGDSRNLMGDKLVKRDVDDII